MCLWRMACWLFAVVHCKQSAVILVLCRNEELPGIKASITNLEQRFNKKYQYPYVFLNDKEFTKEFKSTMQKTCNDRASFGQVEPDEWEMPPGVDRTKAEKAWEGMRKSGVPYATMESYHNMCRFFSRTFYKHPLLANYEYYWRVEPNVKFHCDIDEDPFEYMQQHKKKYGFVITIREFMSSIPTLGQTTAEFIRKNYATLQKKDTKGGTQLFDNHSNFKFMFNDGDYNGCHFWSNFEIGSFEFLRSQKYNAFVDTLEEAGGFYYERWGDAPVHSIAAALLLDMSEIHFFDNIGYTHDTFMHCPVNGKNCDCTPSASVDDTAFSCLNQYKADLKKSVL